MRNFLILLSTIHFIQAVTFEFINQEDGAILVGLKAGIGKPQVEDGGFKLEAGQSLNVTVPDDWEGKIWPRTWCGWPRAGQCLTGDCEARECDGNDGIPPYSAINITLKGKRGYDYYAVSVIHGYNIGVSIEPINGIGRKSRQSGCSIASCMYNFQRDCPEPLQVKHEFTIIACQSPCLFLSTNEYCCQGSCGKHKPEEVCSSQEWKDAQPHHFKTYCPNALTYIHDKQKIFKCKADYYRIKLGGQWKQ